MATQIVMDQTGDTRHEFDPENAEALARAEQRFRELDRNWLHCGAPDRARRSHSDQIVRPDRA